MAENVPQRWQPTTFVRFERAFDTSMGTARIVTDAGPAYIKAMGNRQGPHALACEYVATQLAQWLGLPTLDFALLALDEVDEIPFPRGGQAQPGPAFVTRAMDGRPWSGDANDLKLVDNLDDLSRLVVFDTWTLNCDRYPPYLAAAPPIRECDLPRRPNVDNVLLTGEGAQAGRFRVLAMDHTHCFTCGRDLTERLADIDRVRDDKVYGLFPAFVPLIQEPIVRATAARLGQVTPETVQTMVAAIPGPWDVPDNVRAALVRLVCERAQYLTADKIVGLLTPRCWQQNRFEYGEGSDQ